MRSVLCYILVLSVYFNNLQNATCHCLMQSVNHMTSDLWFTLMLPYCHVSWPTFVFSFMSYGLFCLVCFCQNSGCYEVAGWDFVLIEAYQFFVFYLSVFIRLPELKSFSDLVF